VIGSAVISFPLQVWRSTPNRYPPINSSSVPAVQHAAIQAMAKPSRAPFPDGTRGGDGGGHWPLQSKGMAAA